jgi:hypothetical protein
MVSSVKKTTNQVFVFHYSFHQKEKKIMKYEDFIRDTEKQLRAMD